MEPKEKQKSKFGWKVEKKFDTRVFIMQVSKSKKEKALQRICFRRGRSPFCDSKVLPTTTSSLYRHPFFILLVFQRELSGFFGNRACLGASYATLFLVSEKPGETFDDDALWLWSFSGILPMFIYSAETTATGLIYFQVNYSPILSLDFFLICNCMLQWSVKLV